MSFHNQEFHETKRERKFYEGEKQKALRYIDHTIVELQRDMNYEKGMTSDKPTPYGMAKFYKNKMEALKKLVNDI